MRGKLPIWSARPARSVPIPNRSEPVVATNLGPFLSTRIPPNAAEMPITAMQIMKVACVAVRPHWWAAINGLVKTDQA